jgi:hypothetical protein
VGAAERHTKDQIALQLASYEVSDAVIRLIAPLWNEGPSIDPFYVTVFVNELCDLLPGDTLKAYREQSMVDYERAVVQSSLIVFLALHLGYVDLAFINRLRAEAMREVMSKTARSLPSLELNELAVAAFDSIGPDFVAAPGMLIHADQFRSRRYGMASEKFSSRMRRVEGLAHV